MSADAMRRAIETGLAALDSFEAAIHGLRQALNELLLAPTTTSAKELVSVTDIVRRFPVSRRTVLEARRKGHLRGTRPGGSTVILFDPADVQAWIEGRSSRLRVVR
jgi:excisionase family DNA binding protein